MLRGGRGRADPVTALASRARKIEEHLRQELAEVLWREVRDPRVKNVTLTAVKAGADLEHVLVYFTLLTGDPAGMAEVLNRAAGFLRTQLAHRLQMRTVPKLVFRYDESIARGAHLSQLIDQAVAEDKRHTED